MTARYPQLLRALGEPGWWRPVVGLLLAAVSLVTGAVGVVLAAVVVAAVLGGSTGDDAMEEALSPDGPLGLLANNLVIAVMIPAAALAVLVVHRAPVGALVSVTLRPRWGLLGRFFLVALLLVVVSFAASFVLPGEGTGDVDVPEAGTLVGLLAVILLTTPLQAAAEEVGFRGYVTQAVASWSARPVVGTLAAGGVSGLLFALAHGTQDAALFGDRLAFGLTMSWLVWRTGGLEAAIALHAANNMVSLAFTAATGSLEESLTASALAWSYAVLDVAMMAVFAVVVHRLADRWGVRAVRPVAERDVGALSGPGQVGYPGPRPPAPPPAGGDNPWGMG
ncbi:MAG TPA: type II CAAX endopeptidase family protein [Actinomycetes bacterium]|nr:type II CAAX endopeptidase family protein [Actinomycetes bacterium]